MNTLLFTTSNAIPFLIVVAVLVLISIAIVHHMKHIEQEPEKEESPDLTDEQKEQLQKLNEMIDELRDRYKRMTNSLSSAQTIIDNLQSENTNLKDKVEHQAQIIQSQERKILALNLQIEAIKDPRKEVQIDFTIKVGQTITGRIIPNSNKYVKGKVVHITKRGNYLLDNGKTVSHVDAKRVFEDGC